VTSDLHSGFAQAFRHFKSIEIEKVDLDQSTDLGFGESIEIDLKYEVKPLRNASTRLLIRSSWETLAGVLKIHCRTPR
jgi:hypothetical protein